LNKIRKLLLTVVSCLVLTCFIPTIVYPFSVFAADNTEFSSASQAVFDPSFRLPSPLDQDEKYDGRIIVKYKNQRIQAKEINELSTKLGLKKEKELPLIDAQVMRVTNASVEETITQIERSGLAVYAEPDYKVYPSMFPNDPMFGELWGLHNTGQEIWGWEGTPDVDINAPEAWDISQGSSDVVVAVIDTGVDINHPDLKDNIWVNPGEIPGNGLDDDGNGLIDDVYGWDFYNDDNTLFDIEYEDNHGSHVAGTIAAKINNNEGVAGIAPHVKIMPLKFIGPHGGYISDAILAIEYAKNKGVKISNNSWGGYEYGKALEDAIAKSGMLFVAAAGNENNNTDSTPHYPSAYNLENILSVAACDNQGNRPSFSNYGAATVDIAAPGVCILSTVPLERAAGGGVVSDTGSYKTVFWGFGLEDIDGQANRTDAVRRALNYLDASIIPTGSVLLVDNDLNNTGNKDVNSFYTDALNQLSVTYTVQTVETLYPSLETMKKYSAVIWQTGRDNILNQDQITCLQNYLNSGGKLILAGQDAIYGDWLNNWGFTPGYLHAEILGEGTDRTQIIGMSDTAYSGASYYLGGTDSGLGTGYSRDLLKSLGPHGQVILGYPEADTVFKYFHGTSMAAPHAAGTAALLLSKKPSIDVLTMKNQIMQTAKPLAGWSGLTVTGGMVDAKAALNSLTPAVAEPGTIEDTSNLIQYDGDWELRNYGPATGGKFHRAETAGAFATLTFQGTGVSLISAKADGWGIADIYIDGAKVQSVDCYNATAFWKQTIFSVTNLEEGVHTIKAVCSGEKNPASTGYRIGVDAFVVTDAVPAIAEPGTIEDTSNLIRYDGDWELRNHGPATDGSFHRAETAGASATLTFQGTGVSLISAKADGWGIADIYIDGAKVESVDCYNAAAFWKQTVFSVSNLAEGVHTIKVVCSGEKNPASTGYRIGVDAFVVTDAVPAIAEPGTIEDTSNLIRYDGDWELRNHGPATDGKFHRAETAGASATLTFQGTGVSLISTKADGWGIADIYIDGAKVESVDCYDTTALWQQTIFSVSDLAEGVHAIKVVCSGEKNAASIGYRIGVDAFIVQ
jgi:subtilisin family serine protease